MSVAPHAPVSRFHRWLDHVERIGNALPPLGISLTALLGIGIAQHCGLMGAALRLVVTATPARLITPMVVFAGVSSNAGSEVGYVLLTPLMSYFPLILTFAHKYEPPAGIGTLISTMLPYSVVFLIGWQIFLVIWILLGLAMGPGAPLFLAR